MRVALLVLFLAMCACGKRNTKEDPRLLPDQASREREGVQLNPKILVAQIKNALPFISVTPIESEHGWSTPRVIATRNKNETMGQFVEFQFPKSRYDSDRSEVSEFFESKNGWVFQGGGYPGAPAYVKFNGVTDRISADKKLLEILPLLDKLMRDIADGKPIPTPAKRKILDKHDKEWPECVPPDPDDPYRNFNNNLNINGTPYLCSPEGRWIVDQEAVEYQNKSLLEQSDLLGSLTTRKLTSPELMRVYSGLNIFPNTPYYAAVKYAELYDMLIRQWELQTGTDLPVKTSLSRAVGQYGRSPQEQDNKIAVDQMIEKLRAIAKERVDAKR